MQHALESVPVGLSIPFAHAGKDTGSGWHVQAHGEGLCCKQALQITAQHAQLLVLVKQTVQHPLQW